MGQDQPLHLSIDAGLATLTLNRPASLNALSRELGARLVATLRELRDRPEVRVVVVRGAGERAFCTGADLKERLTSRRMLERSSAARHDRHRQDAAPP